MTPAVIIIGPTSSGKTALSLHLASLFPIEVISADSRQVYKEIEIGTNKVEPRRKAIIRGEYADLVPGRVDKPEFIADSAERRIIKKINGVWDQNSSDSRSPSFQVPHYLIDILSIKDNYNLGQFAQDAYRISRKIEQDGRLPCFVGGTGQYIMSIVKGWFGLRVKAPEIEDASFGELKRVDPEYAKKVDPNNIRRIGRALSIYQKTGEKFSALQKRSRKIWADPAVIGLKWDRDVLYKRIDSAVEKRFEKGIVDEVKSLLVKGVSAKRINALGLSYEWALKAAQGKASKKEAIEKTQYDEHYFVRRQMTWFRKVPEVLWVECK